MWTGVPMIFSDKHGDGQLKMVLERSLALKHLNLLLSFLTLATPEAVWFFCCIVRCEVDLIEVNKA